jgi:sigma-B regulation protein RsbU (phosphoserine phosphatase)
MTLPKSASMGKFLLRTTLVVPFLIQIIATVGLVGYLSFRNGQRVVTDLVGQLQGEISSRVRERVQVYLATPPLTGDLIYYLLDQNGNPTQVAKKTPNYDVRKRPLYETVLKNNRAAWSEVYINFGYGSLQINASSPYYDEPGNLLGIFTCQMGLDQIQGFLQTLQVGRSGQVFVIEPSGELIASSLKDQPLTVGKDSSQKRLTTQESSDPIMRASIESLRRKIQDLPNLQKATPLDFQLDNQRYFLKVSPLRDKYGLNWLIVVVVPEADFMDRINENTRNTFLLCLVALAVWGNCRSLKKK